MTKLRIEFLGTGGGRLVMATQRRRTAGLRFIYGDSLNVHLDPGPGALIFSNWMRLNPQKLDAILISHSHPDHYCDTEVLIEAMSHGTTQKRGFVVAPRSVLRGNEVCGPAISRYHQSLVEEVIELSVGGRAQLKELNITATKAHHSDPDGVGFRVGTPDLGDVAYTSDTELFDGIEEYYRGVRLLILCTMRPRGAPLPLHLSANDAIRLVGAVKPKCAVLTGFGMRMLAAKPHVEAEAIQKETGIPTIAADDGMRLVVGEKIEVGNRKKEASTWVVEA